MTDRTTGKRSLTERPILAFPFAKRLRFQTDPSFSPDHEEHDVPISPEHDPFVPNNVLEDDLNIGKLPDANTTPSQIQLDELPPEELIALFNKSSTNELQKLLSMGISKEEAIQRIVHKLRTQSKIEHHLHEPEQLFNQLSISFTKTNLETISTIHTEIIHLRGLGMSTASVILELLTRLRQNRNKRTRILRFSSNMTIDDPSGDGFDFDKFSNSSPLKKPKFDSLSLNADESNAPLPEPHTDIVLENLLRKRPRCNEDLQDDAPDQLIDSPKKSKLDHI